MDECDPPGYRELAPPPECRSVWAVLWSQRAGPGGHLQRVLPDGHADLVVDRRGVALLVGPATGVAMVELPAGARLHGLRLTPPAVRAVLDVPAHELTDRSVPAAELLGPARAGLVVAALLERDRMARVELRRWLAEVRPDPRAQLAARELWRQPRAEVGEIAGLVGLSPRQLGRVLRAEIGLGPKTFQRVGRLRRFLAGVGAHPGAGLAELAIRAGYADQPHLSREARALGGLSAARLRDFQLGRPA